MNVSARGAGVGRCWRHGVCAAHVDGRVRRCVEEEGERCGASDPFGSIQTEFVCALPGHCRLGLQLHVGVRLTRAPSL